MGFTIDCFAMCFDPSNGFHDGFTIDYFPTYFELSNEFHDRFHDEFHTIIYKKKSFKLKKIYLPSKYTINISMNG